MPQSFQFEDPEARFWVPLAFTAQQKSDDARHSNSWYNIGRLKPGATVEQAQAEVNALNNANLERFPQYKQLLINAGFRTHVDRLQDILVRDVRPTLYLLWGGAILVLLIGGVNLANLTLARASVRMKELSTRLALGAVRARLARQLVIESLMLSLAGGAAGVLTGAVILRTLQGIGLDRLPRAGEIHIDAAVVGQRSRCHWSPAFSSAWFRLHRWSVSTSTRCCVKKAEQEPAVTKRAEFAACWSLLRLVSLLCC